MEIKTLSNGITVVRRVNETWGKNHRTVCFEAYEPSSYMGVHRSLYSIGGKVHGTVSSRAIPEQIDVLPQGVERWIACDEWRQKNLTEAFLAIVEAFPEAERGERDMLTGEISFSF